MLLVTYFDKLVSNVEPPPERVTAVSEAHNSLRSHLMDEAALTFPLADSFLSGSYARHTAPDPIKDADIILILKHTDVTNKPAPKAVLEDLRAAVDEFYENVDLQPQRRSIQISLPEDDIRMDIVPAIAPEGKENLLWVPDSDQGTWIQSHPHGHIGRATGLNATGYFKRVVKVLKWWKTKKIAKEFIPKSFLVEILTGTYFDNEAQTACDAFAGTLKNMVNGLRGFRNAGSAPPVPDPLLPSNDLSESCTWTDDQFVHFYDQLAALNELVVTANNSKTNRDDTVALWQSVFGADLYPSSLTKAEEDATAVDHVQARRLFPFHAEVIAELAPDKEAAPRERYPSNGRRLPKGWGLRFRLVKTDVEAPFTVMWRVTNHGAQARAAGPGNQSYVRIGSDPQWRDLAYSGHHFMDCEIHKQGEVVARARHIVNVR